MKDKNAVRKVAVENFLMSVDRSMPKELHLENLQSDAHSYGWNKATIKAIKDGINNIYKGVK